MATVLTVHWTCIDSVSPQTAAFVSIYVQSIKRQYNFPWSRSIYLSVSFPDLKNSCIELCTCTCSKGVNLWTNSNLCFWPKTRLLFVLSTPDGACQSLLLIESKSLQFQQVNESCMKIYQVMIGLLFSMRLEPLSKIDLTVCSTWCSLMQ